MMEGGHKDSPPASIPDIEGSMQFRFLCMEHAVMNLRKFQWTDRTQVSLNLRKTFVFRSGLKQTGCIDRDTDNQRFGSHRCETNPTQLSLSCGTSMANSNNRHPREHPVANCALTGLARKRGQSPS